MTCGIVGAGRIGRAIATHVIRAGHQVILSNSRGPASLASMVEELGANARGGTVAEAAAAPVVFLAVGWSHIREALANLPPWNARIVVDATNPFVQDGAGYRIADLGGRTSSEVVATLVPGARLVKAFNTLPVATLAADPRHAGGRRVVFVSGDDEAAKAEVRTLIEGLGFAALDLGGLAAGGKAQGVGGSLVGADLIRLA